MRMAFHALDHKDEVDNKNEGSLDVKCLGVAMEMFGSQLDESGLSKVMGEVDTNHNGRVQFSEFARRMATFFNEQRSQ